MAEHMGVIESLARDPGDEANRRFKHQYMRDLQIALGAEALRAHRGHALIALSHRQMRRASSAAPASEDRNDG